MRKRGEVFISEEDKRRKVIRDAAVKVLKHQISEDVKSGRIRIDVILTIRKDNGETIKESLLLAKSPLSITQ